MDWVAAIREEGRTSSILRTDELARKYGIGPPSVTQALSRLERKGFVEHVNDKTYYNCLAPDGSARDLVNILRADAMSRLSLLFTNMA